MTVVSLQGIAVPGSREPVADVVERLEMLLQRAREGELHGLAFVTVVDNAVGHGWVGNAECHRMLAGAAILQYRMAKDSDERSDSAA